MAVDIIKMKSGKAKVIENDVTSTGMASTMELLRKGDEMGQLYKQ